MVIKNEVLYLSYNGMMEPLGASQVLSYLYNLSKDYKFILISLEKKEDLKNKIEFNLLQEKLNKFGINWIPLTYENDLKGKASNFLKFTLKSYQIIKRNNIQFIHCRSYLPAMTAYLIQRRLRIKYIFDTRGFAFDEKADIGSLNRDRPLFKILKRFEKLIYENAVGVNKLSQLGKKTILNNELFKGGNKINNITVIPTCVDLERFKFHKRNYSDVLTIGYVGTATGWYNFDKTLEALLAISKVRKVKFLVFNGNQHDFIISKLKNHGFTTDSYKIEKIPFQEMPLRLKEIDIALFYIHPYFSKKASAATKLGEFFASGIPVITNNNVGDHQYYIETYNAGKIIDFENIEKIDFNTIINDLATPATSINCRLVAEKYFSLENAVKSYKELYAKVFK